MAERLTPRTPDLEFRGSSLARRVVSLDKELYSANCLSSPRCINGYRRHPAGGNPAMDKHPVQGRVSILRGMLHAKETGISSGLFNLDL